MAHPTRFELVTSAFGGQYLAHISQWLTSKINNLVSLHVAERRCLSLGTVPKLCQVCQPKCAAYPLISATATPRDF